MRLDNCLIWGTQLTGTEYISYHERLMYYVDSPRAGGLYRVNRRAQRMIEGLKDDRKKAVLTSWLIEQRRLGVEQPELNEYNIKSITQRPSMAVHDRADELLKYISAKTSNIGQKYEFWIGTAYDNEMEILAYTESVHHWEWEYLLDYLVRQGWLEKREIGESEPPECHSEFTCLTVEGYGRLAELEQVATDSSRVFVAMWFHKSLDPVYNEAISPAVENMGYKPIRVDREHHLDRIDDRIIADIRRSRFIIADFTQGDDGARGEAYTTKRDTHTGSTSP